MIQRLVASFAILLSLVAPLRAAQEPSEPAVRAAPWSEEAVAAAEVLPIQDGGRIKPLHTYASYLLLRLNGKRSVETPSGERLEPVPWLLDVVFFPEAAAEYRSFVVQDAHAVEAIGVSTDGKKKKDRYSYSELRPGLSRLFELARKYERIEEKARSSVQQQVYLLARNVDEYQGVADFARFARASIPVGSGGRLAELLGGGGSAPLSRVAANGRALVALRDELAADPSRADESRALDEVLHSTLDAIRGAQALALIPPVADAKTDPQWLTPADVVEGAFAGSAEARHLELLAVFEALAAARGEPRSFAAALEDLGARTGELARSRGELEKVGLELSYYKAGLIGRALELFVLAFVLAALTWLRPRSRILYLATSAAVVVPTLLLVAAITMRCLIRERPPVSTLYETVLFVTATGALTALVIEAIGRKRIALSAAAALGMVGLFVSNGYEMLDKRDTMPSLVAVLDTNFWLATHVTAITIGYSAGMLAALLASVYLVSRFSPRARANDAFGISLSRMIYGVLCFGLIFSVVGTILGGVWANESWGRFWGWDPKENGALLIVISQLVILHARMGGYLRAFGVAMGAAFGGTVVAFSWFGVNLLGVGLHSYGFTSGIHTWLWTYYIGQWGLIVAAGAHHLLVVRARDPKRARAPAPAAAPGARA
jgi:ABC-type transport system involved in cytochrome c biogenesis permease subunit